VRVILPIGVMILGIAIGFISSKWINSNKIEEIPMYKINKDYGNYEFLPMYEMNKIKKRVEVRM
jgi:hypothetical protein